jgi:hypothetical protein
MHLPRRLPIREAKSASTWATLHAVSVNFQAPAVGETGRRPGGGGAMQPRDPKGDNPIRMPT